MERPAVGGGGTRRRLFLRFSGKVKRMGAYVLCFFVHRIFFVSLWVGSQVVGCKEERFPCPDPKSVKEPKASN